MKIAVITDFLDYGTSGIGNYILNLVEKLLEIDQGNDYLLIHRKKSALGVYRKVEEILMPAFPLPPKMTLRKNITLLKVLHREGVDVLHEPTQITPSIVHLPCRRVLTVHDIIPIVQSNANSISRLYYKNVLLKACKKADKIIAVSENTKRDLMRHLNMPEEKISVIHYGLDERFKPRGEKEKNEVKEKYNIDFPFILYVGSFEMRKNIPMLISAFSKLKKKGFEHKLLLAGERRYEYGSILEKVRKPDIEGDVRFLGQVPAEDLPALYSLADVFVYPSTYEGFGLPPLEAMACGTPVVSSNRSSLPEVVGNAGLTVNPDNPQELEEAIWRVLHDDHLRGELIERGLENAGNFSWSGAARKTLEIYKEVTAK